LEDNLMSVLRNENPRELENSRLLSPPPRLR
jgi:hypothetical protein